MDAGIIGGVVLGIVLIFASIAANGGSIGSFVDLASVLIVVGGTVASAFVHFDIDQMKRLGALLRVAMTPPASTPAQIIRQMVRLAEKARREGLLSLEDETADLADPFLEKGLNLVVDGTDPETVRQILDIELTFLEERHRIGRQIFEHMGAMAPAFGMVGTLIGLIIMLGHLDEPDMIGPAMAVALITTFYGVLIANLICIPIAGKLELRSNHEVLLGEMKIEGILAIQAGENPRIVEHKLQAFLAPRQRLDGSELRQRQGVEQVVSSSVR